MHKCPKRFLDIYYRYSGAFIDAILWLDNYVSKIVEKNKNKFTIKEWKIMFPEKRNGNIWGQKAAEIIESKNLIYNGFSKKYSSLKTIRNNIVHAKDFYKENLNDLYNNGLLNAISLLDTVIKNDGFLNELRKLETKYKSIYEKDVLC
ncbi:MAG: hypothetical protein LBL60_01570 [Mycoplasmataceae bacterium]|nr:hypothetical protein [Mycoplasmataceae bacterium]